jgi:K(+)-stimulated pyrophosphate-energized sodium pump
MLFGMNNMAIAEMLGGYMAGVTVSGVLWAIFQNNAGGAWDNAKKSFEAGVMINGEMTFKGSDAHKAAVTGDTVGDPFKDTSGPSMNILIKLTCLIGLVIAPILGGHTTENMELHEEVTIWVDENGVEHEIKEGDDMHFSEAKGAMDVSKEVLVNMTKSEDGTVKAIVTTTTTTNGETVTKEEVFEGTEAEVKAKLQALKDVNATSEKGKKVVKKVIEEVEEKN